MPYHQKLSKDKKLNKIIDQHEILPLKKAKNVFNYLCASIISQQLSTQVAKVIHQRFVNLFDGEEPTPEQVLKLDFDKLRSIGLSNSKTNYVRNVAEFALEFGLENKALNKMNDEELLTHLTQIKGVGKWTVEMLLMFALARENVFSADDLGIQQAMIELYNLEVTDKKKLKIEMQKIAAKWQPYRTYACLLLWKYKDSQKKKLKIKK